MSRTCSLGGLVVINTRERDGAWPQRPRRHPCTVDGAPQIVRTMPPRTRRRRRTPGSRVASWPRALAPTPPGAPSERADPPADAPNSAIARVRTHVLGRALQRRRIAVAMSSASSRLIFVSISASRSALPGRVAPITVGPARTRPRPTLAVSSRPVCIAGAPPNPAGARRRGRAPQALARICAAHPQVRLPRYAGESDGPIYGEERTRVLVVDDEPNITELVSLGLPAHPSDIDPRLRGAAAPRSQRSSRGSRRSQSRASNLRRRGWEA